MEPTLIIGIIGALIAIIEQILSYSPNGYPKSLFQVLVLIGMKIKRLINRRPIDDQLPFLNHDIQF